jgi:transposase-like protein
MAGKTKKAAVSRDTVFGWMRDTGNGAKAAANTFGVSPSTVKSWIRRHGDPRKAPPKQGGAPRGASPSPGAEVEEGRSGGAPPAESNKTEAPTPPAEPLKLKRGERAQVSVTEMDEDAAALLRASVNRILRYMGGESEPPVSAVDIQRVAEEQDIDLGVGELKSIEKALGALHWTPAGAKNAAIALGVIIDKCPDILSFEDTVNAASGEPGVAGTGTVGSDDALGLLRGSLRAS